MIQDGKINYSVGLYDIMVLLPKKKSQGFLKSPVYHNQNKISRFITELGYDCCDLDGYLSIQTGFTLNVDCKKIITEISKFYGFENHRVDFFEFLSYVQTEIRK